MTEAHGERLEGADADGRHRARRDRCVRGNHRHQRDLRSRLPDRRENTRPLALGQGVWETVTGVRDYTLYVADPTAGQVALYTVIDTAERPGLLALRLEVEGRLISEVESVYVGIGQTGFGSVDTLVEADPIWSAVVPPEQRRSREELIDIADRYFETLEKQIVDHVPFTDDCLRIENGVQTAGLTGGQGLAALGSART